MSAAQRTCSIPAFDVARFWSRVDRRGPDDCWPWTGPVAPQGYGVTYAGGKRQGAHRVAYQLNVGPIPPGLCIDHLCHNADPLCGLDNDCPHRRCCNPAHLEATTSQMNSLRGNTMAARNAAKTHCPYGHPYDDANTRVAPDRGRRCRICDCDRKRRKRAIPTLEIPCAECGVVIQTTRSWKRYCGEGCKKRAQARMRRAKL